MRITNPTALLGEDEACKYLQKIGYRIIERNFRKRNGEVDIIALHENTLVFIEVKTRSSNQFGEPLESIGYFKLKVLIKTAQLYKMLYPNLPENLRIDAIGIMISNDGEIDKLDHVKNISGF